MPDNKNQAEFNKTRSNSFVNIDKNSKINQNLKNKFKVLHWNCNSIADKAIVFNLLIQKQKPDVISLNEIKCSVEEANLYLRFDGYYPIFKCRNSKGGGVALLVNENLNWEEIELPTQLKAEIIGIKIKTLNSEIAICSYYNSPKEKINKSVIDYLVEKYKNLIIAGDLNAKISLTNSLEKNNPNGNILEKILTESAIQILDLNDNQPTSFYNKNGKSSNNKLDYFLGSDSIANRLNEYKVLQNSLVSIYEKNYFHVPIEITVEIQKEELKTYETKNMQSFIYARANWAKMRTEMDKNLELTTLKSLNSSEKAEKLTSIIKNAAESSIPLSRATRRRPIELPGYMT